ncbi:hypothetical protein V6N12_050936 [Hibiscus sabdariffa]|uniref:Putative plant transposon protein domain-containing protein n=1 Tax=Hibiscus sabdariffa TaxID=183260 RepID=A0ABR2GDU6_9ROSI
MVKCKNATGSSRPPPPPEPVEIAIFENDAAEERYLQIQSKQLLQEKGFQNLMPTTHTATVNLPRLQLLHSILNFRSINLGQLIVDEAFSGITHKKSPFLFPRLITALCHQKGVMEDESDFYIRGRQGIKPTQIPSLMGFDEDVTARAPPGGAHTIAAARLAELMVMTEKSQEQI